MYVNHGGLLWKVVPLIAPDSAFECAAAAAIAAAAAAAADNDDNGDLANTGVRRG
jgi:hypothetical protein